MKSGIVVTIVALVIGLLALLELDASAGGKSRPELAFTFRELRAYDPATNAFTGVSYLVKTADGPGCSAVFAANAVAVDKITALPVEGRHFTWSGSRAEFAMTDLPNPCP